MQVSAVILVAILVLGGLNAVSTSQGQDQLERISRLPGQPKVNFLQYAGYIEVDDNHQRALFYYFVESETSSQSKPLVLWLNGGPGCSSVGVGAFSGHGPFIPEGHGLIKNHYSWNKEANILYLDSPAGVGFSYSSNKSFYDHVNDDITARDNLNFLQRWLANYPEYKNRDLLIAGESYAGHFVPQLANLILKSELKKNLKGIAIGNPLLEFDTDFNSRAEYFWSHGLISDTTLEMYKTICNYSQIRRQIISGKLSPGCFKVNMQTVGEIGKFVDPFSVLDDLCLSHLTLQSQILNPMLGGLKVCDDDKTTMYLRRKDVQRALHAKLIGVSEWSQCSTVVNYDMHQLEASTLPLLGTLVRSGIRVLVYSGDQDSAMPFTGTRILVNRLAEEMGLKTTQPYVSWLHGRHVGGWTKVYENILTFATIRGASHQPPSSQPELSLALFKMFVQGKPLPPAPK